MHLRESALAIFRDTPLNKTPPGYYQLTQYHLHYSFLPHLPWPVNMVEKSKFTLWERSISCNFQHASPWKCSGNFLRNFTHANYPWLLPSTVVAYPLRISFLHHLPWPVNKDKKLDIFTGQNALFFPQNWLIQYYNLLHSSLNKLQQYA